MCLSRLEIEAIENPSLADVIGILTTNNGTGVVARYLLGSPQKLRLTFHDFFQVDAAVR